jgi:hypothetical protein
MTADCGNVCPVVSESTDAIDDPYSDSDSEPDTTANSSAMQRRRQSVVGLSLSTDASIGIGYRRNSESAARALAKSHAPVLTVGNGENAPPQFMKKLQMLGKQEYLRVWESPVVLAGLAGTWSASKRVQWVIDKVCACVCVTLA